MIVKLTETYDRDALEEKLKQEFPDMKVVKYSHNKNITVQKKTSYYP